MLLFPPTWRGGQVSPHFGVKNQPDNVQDVVSNTSVSVAHKEGRCIGMQRYVGMVSYCPKFYPPVATPQTGELRRYGFFSSKLDPRAAHKKECYVDMVFSCPPETGKLCWYAFFLL